MFVPQKIPSSSKIDEDMKGYVETNPLVNTFLLDEAFIYSLLSEIGKQDRKVCSCLKFARLV